MEVPDELSELLLHDKVVGLVRIGRVKEVIGEKSSTLIKAIHFNLLENKYLINKTPKVHILFSWTNFTY